MIGKENKPFDKFDFHYRWGLTDIMYVSGPPRTVGFDYKKERIKELKDIGMNNTDIAIHDFMVNVFGDGFVLFDEYFGSLSDPLKRLKQ